MPWPLWHSLTSFIQSTGVFRENTGSVSPRAVRPSCPCSLALLLLVDSPLLFITGLPAAICPLPFLQCRCQHWLFKTQAERTGSVDTGQGALPNGTDATIKWKLWPAQPPGRGQRSVWLAGMWASLYGTVCTYRCHCYRMTGCSSEGRNWPPTRGHTNRVFLLQLFQRSRHEKTCLENPKVSGTSIIAVTGGGHLLPGGTQWSPSCPHSILQCHFPSTHSPHLPKTSPS